MGQYSGHPDHNSFLYRTLDLQPLPAKCRIETYYCRLWDTVVMETFGKCTGKKSLAESFNKPD
jgi:hypothetical protein